METQYNFYSQTNPWFLSIESEQNKNQEISKRGYIPKVKTLYLKLLYILQSIYDTKKIAFWKGTGC